MALMIEPVYAVRCFRNGKRLKIDDMNKEEAKIFKDAAKHMLKLLTKNKR